MNVVQSNRSISQSKRSSKEQKNSILNNKIIVKRSRKEKVPFNSSFYDSKSNKPTSEKAEDE